MDCNGCVQKIKKALRGLYDPEKIVKAIKKTRKIATICNIEPVEVEPSSQPTEPEREGNAQVTEATQHVEIPPTQVEKPPRDTPLHEQTQHEATPPPTHAENNLNQQSPRTNDVKDVHWIHHNPPNYGNRFGYGRNHNYVEHCGERQHPSQTFLQEPPQPFYVTHSYNTYRPSPYVTEYEYVRSPPRHTHYSSGHCQNGNGNITSMFSDENPNACRIV
ncbi:hypothetical protein Fmac_009667 [Flemingia macrophylla]|uniref:HMA domain-containing protein n=1 Tax=Flemingia macrophylla TaxID=520843 RepID=A0ABD1N0X3_9FABA